MYVIIKKNLFIQHCGGRERQLPALMTIKQKLGIKPMDPERLVI